MQLIIESESISDKNMSTLEETQDKQIAVIADIKKDIQSLKDDTQKDGASDAAAEKDAEAVKQSIIEAKTNGGIGSSMVNGTESHNDNKENDAPKMDISLEAVSEEEESIENITNCVNSLFGITEDSKSDNLTNKSPVPIDTKVDNNTDSVGNDSAKESDKKMEIENKMEIDNDLDTPESPSRQLLNELSCSTKMDDAVNGDTKQDSSSTILKSDYTISKETNQDSVKSAEICELSAETETIEKMDVDTNNSGESEFIFNLEDTNIDTVADDISLNHTVSNDVNEIPLQDNANDAASNDTNKTLQDKVIDDTAACPNLSKPDEKFKESTVTTESDINNSFENVSDPQIDPKIVLDKDSTHTNDNIANDQQSSQVTVASPSKQVVENETAGDVILAPTEKENVVKDISIDSSSNISKDKMADNKNDTTEICLVSNEKVNDITENETSLKDVATIGSSSDILEDKLDNNKKYVNDIDLIGIEKNVNIATNNSEKIVENVKNNETSHKVATKNISEEILSDNKHDDSSIENLCEDTNTENKSNNKSEHDTDTTSIEQKESFISEAKLAESKNDDSSVENLPENTNEENMSDNKCEDVSGTSSVEQIEGSSTGIEPKENDNTEKTVDETAPDAEDKKDPDTVNISSMEVDDVEIVHEKDNTENTGNQKETTETSSSNLQDNNVIEILDQESTETTTDKVDKEIQKGSLDTKPDVTYPSKEIKNKDEISDEDDIKIIEESKTEDIKEPAVKTESKLIVVCKLSNTLDILSDDEEEPAEPPAKKAKVEEKPQQVDDKQCINIDDDDDIMLIEDMKETPVEPKKSVESDVKTPVAVKNESCENETKTAEESLPNVVEKDVPITETNSSPQLSEKEPESPKEEVKEPPKPLLPMNVLKSAKKNLSEMTRDELEEFCILKIVESIVDRSSLSEIKKKMKVIEQNMEEYKKKALVLSKQNRDLQVVLKSVQEEQKNRPSNAITPLKITRSVGMQVLMFEKPKKKPPGPLNSNTNNAPKFPNRTPSQPPKIQKPQSNNQNIPVPKLIPASPAKITANSPMTITKPQTPNGIRNTPSPAQKSIEKRPLTRQTGTNTSASNANNNMTVDLTDDDPPAKVVKSSPVPPVRLVPSQNLMAPRSQTPASNPRKVFIPINGPSQTVVIKNINQQQMGLRGRFPAVPRMPQNQITMNQVRMTKVNVNKHPAPLPDVMKQYQPATWKALPPAPDLKLSKVDNGIVISWKIEGYQEDNYEKIASYQLYAYQETATPPSTALWKKIGDVKALPLPMACTLTQFMAGHKYYFAVRAVDVKSRLGPFSLPGSILLLNKM